MKKIVLTLLISLVFGLIEAQLYQPHDTIIYKHTGQGDLSLHCFYPNDYKKNDQRPAIVFFFGGGWVGGTPKQFYQQSTHLASLGIVCFSAEYRVRNRHKTSPFESVKDAKSAVRYLRQHAAELGINPAKIVAAGGSAGGHVAACTGVITGKDEAGENLTISSVPNAMVLFNPVLDTTEKGYGAEKVKGRETEISPCHHVKKGIVPCILFHGTADKTVPYENAVRFDSLMLASGNDCDLVPTINKGHGFFNSSWFKKANKDEDYKKIMYELELFLWKHSYLEKPSDWTYDFNSALTP
jgi:acetyl esterase/lipase